jgi:DNA-binding Xre family transcriptional regulator
MSKNVEKHIKEIISKLEVLSKEKYDNNVQLAKAVGCTEGAIRYLFRHKKGMTMDLYLKFCNALKIGPDEILK